MDTSDNDVSWALHGREAKLHNPAAVIPGSESSRRDLSGGSEASVESLKDEGGNEETWRWSSKGKRVHTSVNSEESIVAPGWQCRNSVLRFVQFV